jgi:hypothetical protein
MIDVALVAGSNLTGTVVSTFECKLTLPGSPGSFLDPNRSLNGLAQGAATSLRGLLEVLPALDLLGQALFFTELLEPAEHLLCGFTIAGLDTNRHNADVLSNQRIAH